MEEIDNQGKRKLVEVQWKAPLLAKKPKIVVPLKTFDADDKEKEQSSIDYIKSINKNNQIESLIPKKEIENKPLVIPLFDSSKESDLDQQAANEILSELNGSTLQNDSGMTISIKKEVDGEEKSTNKIKPLLLRNVPEEVRNAKNEVEKFKLDMSRRPEDLHAMSDVYQSIPIDQFGAALLRGMGWNGESSDAKAGFDPSKVRPSRLGLGAAIFNPNDQLLKEKKKNASNIGQQYGLFQKGDIVKIVGKEFKGEFARVTLTSGVPGLNKIRVKLEDSKESIDISKSDLELIERPSYPSQNEAKEAEDVVEETKSNPSINQETKSKSNNDNMNANPKDKSINSSSSSSKKPEYIKNDLPPLSELKYWLCTGIRVKIIGKKSKYPDCYLSKGFVIDVPERGIGCIRLDNGKMIDSVPERHLETVLPSVGGNCLVLSGSYKGETARLIEKYNDKEEAMIQLSESLEMTIVNMNYIAATH